MIVIDIETSGLDPSVHGIVSIGAIEFESPENQFYGECYIGEQNHIDPEAVAIMGMDEIELRDKTKQSPFILMKSFIEWMQGINDRTPAGLHIGGFDLQFLKKSANELNLNWPLGNRSVDLHSLFYTHLKTNDIENFTLKNQRSDIYGVKIQKYCGLEAVKKPHNALLDAKWEAECFSRLMFGKKLLPEFEDSAVPDKLILK